MKFPKANIFIIKEPQRTFLLISGTTKKNDKDASYGYCMIMYCYYAMHIIYTGCVSQSNKQKKAWAFVNWKVIKLSFFAGDLNEYHNSPTGKKNY